MFFRKFLRQKRHEAASHKLYLKLVGQSRMQGFYASGGVPDTVDGRFDLIALHTFLIIRRLSGSDASEKEHELAQVLFDLMFADMDRNLREMGVGDLGVGRKVRDMVSAFYGRAEAYEKALQAAPQDNADDKGGVLAAALRRNLYRDANPDDQQLAKMAGYVLKQVGLLNELTGDALLSGEVRFHPAPFQ